MSNLRVETIVRTIVLDPLLFLSYGTTGWWSVNLVPETTTSDP